MSPSGGYITAPGRMFIEWVFAAGSDHFRTRCRGAREEHCMRDDECDSSSAVAMNALLMRVAAALGTVPLRDEQVIEAADRLTTLMHHAHGRKPTDPLFISMIGT